MIDLPPPPPPGSECLFSDPLYATPLTARAVAVLGARPCFLVCPPPRLSAMLPGDPAAVALAAAGLTADRASVHAAAVLAAHGPADPLTRHWRLVAAAASRKDKT